MSVAVKLRKIASELEELAKVIEGKEGVKEVSITLEDVRKVLAELSRDGLTAQVRDLLTKNGANKLSEIDPSKYQELLSDARKLNDANK